MVMGNYVGKTLRVKAQVIGLWTKIIYQVNLAVNRSVRLLRALKYEQVASLFVAHVT